MRYVVLLAAAATLPGAIGDSYNIDHVELILLTQTGNELGDLGCSLIGGTAAQAVQRQRGQRAQECPLPMLGAWWSSVTSLVVPEADVHARR